MVEAVDRVLSHPVRTFGTGHAGTLEHGELDAQLLDTLNQLHDEVGCVKWRRVVCVRTAAGAEETGSVLEH